MFVPIQINLLLHNITDFTERYSHFVISKQFVQFECNEKCIGSEKVICRSISDRYMDRLKIFFIKEKWSKTLKIHRWYVKIAQKQNDKLIFINFLNLMSLSVWHSWKGYTNTYTQLIFLKYSTYVYLIWKLTDWYCGVFRNWFFIKI